MVWIVEPDDARMVILKVPCAAEGSAVKVTTEVAVGVT